ncbi:MAG: NAD(P)/FAD-dependent oxidoreductase [Myxococcales bacterium]|nr:MAG: NAD(P)/FAD-dependent oxidoreductase [Myxococcales bacterium]
MARDADVVVVGGGVIGLAAAAALARAGREVLLLERNGGFGQETSSRNSGVIHAGLYYPSGSLKAHLCVAGREALYARCERMRIPHRRTGKLVVATTPSEVEVLERLLELGTANGAPGLEILDAAALRAREPALQALAALWSPATGIVDPDALCSSFAAEAEAHGAVLLLRSEVIAIEAGDAGFRVEVADPDRTRVRVDCAAVVNAAGLAADRVAACAGLDPDALGYRIHPCKGDYFALAPSAPLRLSTLVYPVPSGAGLGIHATLDLGGRIRFGPDAEYVERADYGVDAAKAGHFAEAAGRYLPGLRPEWLTPDQAGVRPKLAGPGEPFRDFVVAEESAAGLPGFVSCVGIESPGLTAAPAIAERVLELLC